jgi:hypothetical protein
MCLQGCYFYVHILGVDQENELLEQAIHDREIKSARWTSRTTKVIEDQRGHTPRGRIQYALENLALEWVRVEDRPFFYVSIIAARERLSGLDHLVATNPTGGVTSSLFVRLHGTRSPTPLRVRMGWFVDDCGLDRSFLPAVPL